MRACHTATAALLVLFSEPSLPAADGLTGAARELARKTAALAAGRSAVTYGNLSSLPDAALEQVRREFEAVLSGENSPAVAARVTLSENSAQYLLVEEVRKGEESEVWMEGWARSQPAGAAPAAMALDKKLIWEQDEQILDIAFREDRMIVLTPARAALYERHGDAWEPRGVVPIAPAKSWPRDPRGRIRLSGDRVQALLPGWSCGGTIQPEFRLRCGTSDEPWTLESGSSDILLAGFAGERNYFDGRVVAQNGSRKTVPPFYAAAAFAGQGGASWVLALVDGRSGIFDGALEPAGSIPGWGSDLVGMNARCGGGSQVLATRPGGGSGPDAVQPFAVVNRGAVPLAPAVTFPGPVTALWRETATSAVAVSHDPATGKYGAYALTLVCGP